MSTEVDGRLSRARVLVELGSIAEAELEVASVLEARPDHLDALGLFAKIKHINGELSHAIACWAELHARVPHHEGVMTQLFAIAQRAGDPTRTQTAASPQSELEHAFALFHERRPGEALRKCDALAERQRGRDVTQHKLAGLAGAWLAELTGDLSGARSRLEQLGRERGLEHDRDRLLALVRVCGQLGTPDALEAAANICRHVLGELEHSGVEKLSLRGLLVSLERRLGNAEAASALDAEFVARSRRRMHRPELHELVRVAAGEYLPIEHLRAARPVIDAVPTELSRRERALVHAVRGDTGQARMLFADGGEPLDRAYLAELAAHAGDEDRAIELFLAALDGSLADAPILGWLLDRHARAPSVDIAAYWARPERHARALAVLETSCRLAPRRAEVWSRLATLHRLGGDTAHAERCASRAHALAAAATARAMPIGRVLAAGVYHFAGKAKGLLHEISVHRQPVSPTRGGTLAIEDIHGNVTPELRAAIRGTFLSVREYARAHFPDATTDLDNYTYAYQLPKEDELSGGLSAGLPSALALLSTFLQRPISREIASSGAAITDAHDVITVGRIGEAEYKVKAAYHGNLRSLILPAANRPDLEHSTIVPAEIANDVVRYVADLDQAVKLVFGDDAFTRA